MTKKPSLLYLFPTNFEHEGLVIKVKGQCEGLNHYFRVKLYPFLYRRAGSALYKLLASLWYQKWAGIQAIFYSRLYVRYNPKMFPLNLWLCFLSYFKPVYLEHNINLTVELPFLNRTSELWLHKKTIQLFKKSHIIHVSVSPALTQHMQSWGIPASRTLTIQNGYTPQAIHPEQIDPAVINTIQSLQKAGKKLAIFVGSGSGWHGVEEVATLFSAYPHLTLLLVGPYTQLHLPTNVVNLGVLNAATLGQVYAYCAFGIGAWNLDPKAMSCPLKTREYLCFGLPILVNYPDCALEYGAVKPYIFYYQGHNDSLDQLLTFSWDKDALKKTAQDCFNWATLFKPLAPTL